MMAVFVVIVCKMSLCTYRQVDLVSIFIRCMRIHTDGEFSGGYVSRIIHAKLTGFPI